MKTFLEAYDVIPGNGWLSEAEARTMWEFASSCQGPILEVGCHQGRSTVLLAQLGRPVYAVDPYLDDFDSTLSGNDRMNLFLQNVHGRGLENVFLFRQRVEDWSVKPVGFAFLDGDHSYQGTLAQVKKAVGCHPDVIAVHDVNDSGGGKAVKEAALEVLGRWSVRVGSLAIWDYR